MTRRQEEISQAYQRTFSWIFEDTLEESSSKAECTYGLRPWSNFVEWLRADGQVYWINGKAGSGKLTLMRYICGNPETRRYLRSWTKNGKFQLASFYFWNSGSVEQRSHIGLLRSLLHEILKEREDLLREVFQEEWNEAFSIISLKQQINYRLSWSFGRLEKAFYDLIRLATDQLKLCLFIDGLDEYDGDCEAIAELLKNVALSPHVKVCVSSRPWLVFEEAFENGFGLRLQDLTYQDIRNYVSGTLEANKKLEQLALSNPEHAIALVTEIVTKANGVFLWVKLVVWSLLHGLRNRDSISDLQKRLESLPADLDAFYGFMINRINPFYMQQASQIFQIFDAATDLGLNLNILELEIAVTATHAQAMAPEMLIMTDDEIEQRCEMMAAHLKSRCEGLLEVHDPLDRNWEASSRYERESEYRGATMRDRLRLDRKVSYLHRTVKDFLKTPAVRARLLEHTRNLLDFDPHISLLMYFVVSMKWRLSFFCYGTGTGDDEPLRELCKNALQVARKSRKLSSPTSCGLIVLREFYRTASFWWQHPMVADASGSASRNIPSSLDATQFPSIERLLLAKEFRERFLELVGSLG